MSVLKFLLLPLAWVYRFVMALRNYLFDIGHFRSFQFDTVVISVGNLNVGGSGKTPMVEYLIRLLSPNYKLAVLSRGYGRKTSGYRLANDSDTALTLGDEPYQLYRKFAHLVVIAVGEERALAIPSILNDCPDVDVILLDDAFQHRTVVPDFSILLTDYTKPFFNDFVLPAGSLREHQSGAARASAVVVTKCPGQVILETETHVKTKIKQYTPAPVFFSGIRYLEPKSFADTTLTTNRMLLVTAIANSAPLRAFASSSFDVVKHLAYADHHRYSAAEVADIQTQATHHGAVILTTEKDQAKLIHGELKRVLKPEMWWCIPVETAFLNFGAEFDRMVTAAIDEKIKRIDRGEP